MISSRGRTMSDTESIICLSESDEDEVKEISMYDPVSDYGNDDGAPMEKIGDNADCHLAEKTDEDEGGVILQEESFVETKVNPDECCLAKQDMTTQTDEDFAQCDKEKKDFENAIQRKLPENGNASLQGSKNDSKEVNESKNSVNCYRSRNNSTTSCSNNRQIQRSVSVNTGASTRNNNMQKTWNQTRNRPQPYHRPNYNFAQNYNYFGVPSPNYHNYNRQIPHVRERYIQQFKEYLCKSFEQFLNNTLPFTFSQGFNNNIQQGPNNNYSQNNNNFPQGINFPQGNNYQCN